MKQEMNCPLCHERVYSEIGIGCKMCGMALENKNTPKSVSQGGTRTSSPSRSERRPQDISGEMPTRGKKFCSTTCRTKYKRINKLNHRRKNE